VSLRLAFTGLALSVAIVGCTNHAEMKENMLASSGFKPATPTSPAQLASFKALQAHKLTKTTYDGKTVWVYADPTLCGCLYVGDQAAYETYAKKAAQWKAQDAIEARDAAAAQASMNWAYGASMAPSF
jgi:hypothetical protein